MSDAGRVLHAIRMFEILSGIISQKGRKFCLRPARHGTVTGEQRAASRVERDSRRIAGRPLEPEALVPRRLLRSVRARDGGRAVRVRAVLRHRLERALAWIRGRGFFHDGGIPNSEDFIGARLAPGDALGADPIIARFERAAVGVPEALRLALEARLREYALQNAEGAARRTRFRRADWQRTGDQRLQ